MLLRVSDQIRECLDQAAEAAERARAATDPEGRATFLDMERRWMLLVESFRLVEQVQRFMDDGRAASPSALSVVQFLPRGVFDDDTTRLMGQAFDSAVMSLGEKFQPQVIQEIIARRIVTAARKGERDPGRLCDAAIGAVKRAANRPE